VDLASCTASVGPCDDTGTTTGVWPVVARVVLAVLIGLAVWWAVRHRRRRPSRVPQRRVHVSAAGELLRVQELPRG
jgi:hypothetical protein